MRGCHACPWPSWGVIILYLTKSMESTRLAVRMTVQGTYTYVHKCLEIWRFASGLLVFFGFRPSSSYFSSFFSSFFSSSSFSVGVYHRVSKWALGKRVKIFFFRFFGWVPCSPRHRDSLNPWRSIRWVLVSVRISCQGVFSFDDGTKWFCGPLLTVFMSWRPVPFLRNARREKACWVFYEFCSVA